MAMTPADRMAKARAAKAAKKLHVEPVAPEPMAIDQEAAAPRRMHRTPDRADNRSSPRTATGRIVVEGRGGEKLTRTRTGVGDQFEIPENMIPANWCYQWNVVSVVGNTDVVYDQTHMMAQQGWRPVPAERYAGTLLPAGSKGAIIRGGQRLEERPLALTKEAKAEDERNARQLISDRNESLKLAAAKKSMPDGFEMGGRYKGTGGDIRISIDQALDIPRPAHQLAVDGD